MDVVDSLLFRFHFNGEFIHDGKDLYYCGGSEGMSYIERDKMSLPEINGHLKEHCDVVEGMLLHWLFPGKYLGNGLRVLVDDKACQTMSDCIVEGGVAEIYVEAPIAKEDSEDEAEKEDSDYENEIEAMSLGEKDDDDCTIANSKEVSILTATPEQRRKELEAVERFYIPIRSQSKSKQQDGESSDSDYIPGDYCTSEEDEEALDIIKQFKEFKKMMKAGEIANLDDMPFEVPPIQSRCVDGGQVEEEGNETPYANSSQDDDSFDEVDNGGELVRKESKYPRFDPKRHVPTFSLGMKFGDKRLFKDAIPTSQASSCATIQLSSGHASANVSAKEPPRKEPPKKRTTTLPKLLMSSNDVNDNKQ